MPTLTVDGPIQVYFTPYALARSSYHLLQMSRAYTGHKDAHVARHYLYCVSIELGLKAALLAFDISAANKARIKRLGHNLILLSEEFARVYAGSLFSSDDREAIAMIDPYFSAKGLEYFTPPMLEAVLKGYSSLPSIERMEQPLETLWISLRSVVFSSTRRTIRTHTPKRGHDLLQRRKASLKLHHSRARIVALMIAPQNQ